MERLLPTTYLLLAIMLTGVLHLLLPLGVLVPWPWSLAGLAPLVVGVVANLIADRQFKRVRTPVKPAEAPTTLVTEGAFRWSRNPMYLGQVLMVLGIALIEGTLAPWIVVAGHAALLHYGFVLPEERRMEQAFGAAYAQYRQHVRRWI